MGFWSTLLGVGAAAAAPFTGGTSLAFLPAALGAGSAALGAVSHGQANNRGEKFAGQLDLQQLLMQRDQQAYQNAIAREQEGRASASDAWKKLLSAQHTLSPAAMPNITPYATPQRQATDAERAGAEALSAEVMKRLQGGNPIGPFQQSPLQVDPRLLDPGTLERILGYTSAGLGAAGAIAGRRGGGNVYSEGGSPIYS